MKTEPWRAGVALKMVAAHLDSLAHRMRRKQKPAPGAGPRPEPEPRLEADAEAGRLMDQAGTLMALAEQRLVQQLVEWTQVGGPV